RAGNPKADALAVPIDKMLDLTDASGKGLNHGGVGGLIRRDFNHALTSDSFQARAAAPILWPGGNPCSLIKRFSVVQLRTMFLSLRSLKRRYTSMRIIYDGR